MFQPDYNAAKEVLDNLDSDELKDILNDETKFDELFNDHIMQVQNWTAEKERIMEKNQSLASTNLEREPDLIVKKGELQELTDRGKELCTGIQDLLNELKSKSGELSLDTALALLQTAAAEMEEQSEEIADKFLSGDLELDQFLEEFTEKRKLMHLRKFKADKMPELISLKSVIPVANPRNHYMPSNLPYGNPAPYPLGNFNMPMPGMFR